MSKNSSSSCDCMRYLRLVSKTYASNDAQLRMAMESGKGSLSWGMSLPIMEMVAAAEKPQEPLQE